MLKEGKNINFIGNVEAREIPHGPADVIVCEAFVGNIILKLSKVSEVSWYTDQERHDGTLRTKICASCKTGTEDDAEDFRLHSVRRSTAAGLKRSRCEDPRKRYKQRNQTYDFSVYAFQQQKINEKIKESIQPE